MATEARAHGRAVSAQANRPTQEDRFSIWEGLLLQIPTQIYAVFDGHNGTLAADTCQRYLTVDLLRAVSSAPPPDDDLSGALRSAVASLEARVLSATAAAHTYDGTTLCVIVIRNRVMYSCNVGDSRALLVRADAAAVQLTVDHTVRQSDERRRLEAADAPLRRNRLLGERKDLELSRALGDREFKTAARRGARVQATLIATPDIERRALSAHDELVLLATDGMCDIAFLDNDELARMALQEWRRSQDVAFTASQLVEQALRFGASDNVTLIVIALRSAAAAGSASGAQHGVMHRVHTHSGAPDDTAYATCEYWEASRMSTDRRYSVMHSVSSLVTIPRRRKKSRRDRR